MSKLINIIDSYLVKSTSMDISDLIRTFRLVIIAIVLIVLSDHLPNLVGEPILSPVLFSIGVAAIVWPVSHMIRRILMPRLDMQDIAIKAINDNNISAALSFIAIILFYIMVAIGIIILVN